MAWYFETIASNDGQIDLHKRSFVRVDQITRYKILFKDDYEKLTRVETRMYLLNDCEYFYTFVWKTIVLRIISDLCHSFERFQCEFFQFSSLLVSHTHSAPRTTRHEIHNTHIIYRNILRDMHYDLFGIFGKLQVILIWFCRTNL